MNAGVPTSNLSFYAYTMQQEQSVHGLEEEGDNEKVELCEALQELMGGQQHCVQRDLQRSAPPRRSRAPPRPLKAK